MGWFADPTGRHLYRWWEPRGWTGHVWDGERLGRDMVIAPWRRIAIVVLACLAALAVGVGALMAMGDVAFSGRSGLVRHDEALTIVSAVCPGERLLSLRLTEVDPTTGSSTVIWRITGDAPLPSELLAGHAPTGMTADSDYRVPAATANLLLDIETSKLDFGNEVRATQADLIDGNVVGTDGRFADRDTFSRSVMDELPCDDPYGDHRQRRLVGGALLAALTAVALVGACLVTKRRYPGPDRGDLSSG
jgi:hypothetical protein